MSDDVLSVDVMLEHRGECVRFVSAEGVNEGTGETDSLRLLGPGTVWLREGTDRATALRVLRDLAGVLEEKFGTMSDGEAGEVKVAPVDDPDAGLWKAYDRAGTLDGYLVTAPHDLDRVIAYIGFDDLSESDALALARRICEDPEVAGWGGPGYDLRPYGQPGSAAPMPQWVYGLKCRPLRGGSRGYISPAPYCRFMLGRIARQKKGDTPVANDAHQPASEESDEAESLTAA
jgi:hypothetical protein